ncbi:hypothetical protein BDP27DRAFT_247986 [Rhodocollybia butyracea]|uniref:Uncharacterized protein n=1 Tax=Rhodocollybia butyracea TaxID=206335 RepID=A0A9P5PJK5_9AGAR|nr:hypothetical protein BDP27DRAFT_247986 [Rhodocollybia butyracea]
MYVLRNIRRKDRTAKIQQLLPTTTLGNIDHGGTLFRPGSVSSRVEVAMYNSSGHFSAKGDSGSLVFTGNGSFRKHDSHQHSQYSRRRQISYTSEWPIYRGPAGVHTNPSPTRSLHSSGITATATLPPVIPVRLALFIPLASQPQLHRL